MNFYCTYTCRKQLQLFTNWYLCTSYHYRVCVILFRLQKTDEGHRWVATAFGKACLAASIPPKDGLFLLEELQKARRCFVLDTELHVIYLVTPLSSGNQIGTIDWMTFLELWKTLSESERRVGQLVGVEERFLTSAIKGIMRKGRAVNYLITV